MSVSPWLIQPEEQIAIITALFNSRNQIIVLFSILLSIFQNFNLLVYKGNNMGYKSNSASKTKNLFGLSMPKFSPAILVSLVFVAGLYACNKSHGDEEQDKEITDRGEKRINVEVMKITPHHLEETMVLRGIARPFQHLQISAEIGGLVEAVNFKEGSAIKKGQLLIKIDREMAEVRFKQAKLRHKQAKQEFDRGKKLKGKRLISSNQLEKLATALEAANLEMEITRLQLDKTTIHSPINGIVTKQFLQRGEYAKPTAPVAELVDIAKIKVMADLPERDYPHVRKGMMVKLKVAAFPLRLFKGAIVNKGVMANTTNRTFPVEIVAPNPNRHIAPGMEIKVHIVKKTHTQVMVVPRDALIDSLDEKRYIWLIKKGNVEKRLVVTGYSDGNRIIVVSGLNPRDSIVVVGHRSLVEGVPVNVVTQHQCCQLVKKQ